MPSVVSGRQYWPVTSNEGNNISSLNGVSKPTMIFSYFIKSYPGLIYIIATVIFYIIIFISLVFSNFYANSNSSEKSKKSRGKRRRTFRRATLRSMVFPGKQESCTLDTQQNERLI